MRTIMKETDDIPQSPPEAGRSDLHELRRRRHFWIRAIWISLGAVIVPLMFALIAKLSTMIGMFDKLSRLESAGPEVLQDDMASILHTTQWSLAISAIAFIFLIVALMQFFTLPKQERGLPRRF